MAELEQLRVGVFQQLDDGFRARSAVIEKGAIPADHRQIVRIVRNLRLQYFLAFAIRQGAVFTAHDLRNASPFNGEQFGRGRVSGDLAYVEDKVIFVQPLVVGLDQSRPRALQLLPGDLLREAGKVRLPNPAAGQTDKGVPVARKRQFEYHTQHAVVVVLD